MPGIFVQAVIKSFTADISSMMDKCGLAYPCTRSGEDIDEFMIARDALGDLLLVK